MPFVRLNPWLVSRTDSTAPWLRFFFPSSLVYFPLVESTGEGGSTGNNAATGPLGEKTQRPPGGPEKLHYPLPLSPLVRLYSSFVAAGTENAPFAFFTKRRNFILFFPPFHSLYRCLCDRQTLGSREQCPVARSSF